MTLSSEELADRGSKTCGKKEREPKRDRNSSALQKEDGLLSRCGLP